MEQAARRLIRLLAIVATVFLAVVYAWPWYWWLPLGFAAYLLAPIPAALVGGLALRRYAKRPDLVLRDMEREQNSRLR